MVQSILDRRLRTAKSCCHCINLKDGTIIIAVLGFIAGVYYILFFAFAGELLKELQLSEWSSDMLLHVHAVFGVLLCAVHGMLLVAAIIYQEVVILLYIWVIIVYIFVDVLLVLYITVQAVVAGIGAHTLVWLILPSIICMIVFYFVFVPVVNGFRKNIHTVVVVIT